MDQQQSTLLRAIALSSLHLASYAQKDRLQAYEILETFKRFEGRLPIILGWLHSTSHFYNQHDITVATKLLALEILSAFLDKGYEKISELDRVELRRAVLKSAHLLSTNTLPEGSRILSKKLAFILENLVVRDFPQRWTTFANDVFASQQDGGLWYNEPGPQAVQHQGVRICLECLKLVAENCTDSDFNARISTTRRNDVLIGLNEVSGAFLPKMFQLLEHYPVLRQAKDTMHSMHAFLVSDNRATNQMTAEESSQYQAQKELREGTAQMISDTLLALRTFCCSMPVNWITGGSIDFLTALLHLMREPDYEIQIRAVECIEQLALRGKLDFGQWLRLITNIPLAVQEANHLFAVEYEHLMTEDLAKGVKKHTQDPLALQLQFHRSTSRLLANVVSSHLALVTSNKSILSGNGDVYEKLMVFFRLQVDMLHHPSGRICTEQINSWVALLRDPQLSKARLLKPFVDEILKSYMNQMIKIRWEDVENELHPHSVLLAASFDDEEDFEIWMSDLRSRSSLLFKFLGSVEPEISSTTVSSTFQSILYKYGNGQPFDNVESFNSQLTQRSEAVVQFEALYQPMDTVLGGIPVWAINVEKPIPRDRLDGQSSRDGTRRALSELVQALLSWSPTHVWLKFRRAQLLDALKHYWKNGHDSSTLLEAVDSLLKYLGLPDEWNLSTVVGETMSDEIVGLKKKSGVTLVSISKQVPNQLLPWLSQLSDASKSLLSSHGLIPVNQMHLYEFLSCVASAVEDPNRRASFIAEVLSNAADTLELPEVQSSLSVQGLLETLGVSQAAALPESVTDAAHVKQITWQYYRIFNALNRLLSVGKRCNEAARKRYGSTASPTVSSSSAFDSIGSQNFPDEGPISIVDLATIDPFAPLWPRILPSFLKVYEATMAVWRPENQARLLQNPYQRYLFAISDDEAFQSKNHDQSSGGVFGESGTAGSVVMGTTRRDNNLVPKWSGWFNELRHTCFQMFGLLCTQRVLFAPELASSYPRIVAVVTDPASMKAMEHRHFIHFLKHVVELLLVSCPSTMYATHLEPILGPVFEHIKYRLEKTWLPILNSSTPPSGAAKALTSKGCSYAAALASRGGDDWFTWYYAHAGLFVGDLDSVTAEAAVEKYRVEIGRNFSDVLQVALALKGDWALVLANQAREEQAAKRNGYTKPTPQNRLNQDSEQYNADGTLKSDDQQAIDERKALRINGLCHFILLENELVAGNLTMALIQCLEYPDAYTCRRVTKICHRLLETVAWSPSYSNLLGNMMFTQAVKNLVTEPKWMVGIEWDMINVVRDIYCRLVLGQILQAGGQGPGLQQPSASQKPDCYEQAKTVDRPLQGGGILVNPTDAPRQILLTLPGIDAIAIEQLERSMKAKPSAKDQKDFIRDLLRVAADSLNEISPSTNIGAASGLFDRAVQEESLLHSRNKASIPDLPEKLITHSQLLKAAKRQGTDEPEGLAVLLQEY
jgi:hypothetical protein